MQRQPPVLPVYDRCELVGHLTREEYAPRLKKGEFRAAGSRRSIKALHVIHKSGAELKGPIPKQPPMSFRQHIGDVHVWQHSHRALQWGMA